MYKLNHDQIAKLVVKAQNGDQEAFGMLYTATVEKQIHFATAFLKDSSLAEDAVQEVYISMFKALPTLKNPKAFVSYLNRICYNTCVDFSRKYNEKKYELDDDKISRLPDSSNNTPVNRYESLEESNHLYRALSTLPENHRAAFLLRYYNSMKIKDIAASMSISEATVKRYIKAAAKSMAGELSKSIERVEVTQ